MKKILVSAVIALTIVNVSAKGKCETHYVNTIAESSIACNMVCNKEDCVDTIIIQDKIKDKKQKIDKLSEEISEIWSPYSPDGQFDTNGSYTGKPDGFQVPVQDADDL